MADGLTNRGAYRLLEWFGRGTWKGGGMPTNWYVALITDAAFDPDWNVMGDVTEITGSGYTAGGVQLTPGATDFDVLTEVDASDWALTQIKDIYWLANGGSIPTAGDACMAVLTDDNATVADREIIWAWDITDSSVADGAVLQLEDLEMKLDTVA